MSKLNGVKKLARYLSLVAMILIATGAKAQSVKVNFATPVVTADNSTAAPGVWYIDRFAPGAFSSPEIAPDGTRNTLEESIYASGYQAPDSFYNTQGRAYQLIANTYSTSILLYVPSTWQTENARMAGFGPSHPTPPAMSEIIRSLNSRDRLPAICKARATTRMAELRDSTVGTT